ncbi:MAG TPA: PAS domain S-box protein, partial [Spirochaetes bacterium]|nr:PAS domain S-box protein [Spirochaetota bacterium]
SRALAERDRLLDSLRESEARYRTFMDSTADLVFLKDEKFRYMLVNRANQEFFGLPEEEIVGKTDFELMPEPAAKSCLRSDQEAAATEGIVTTYEQVNDKMYESRKFSVPLKDNARGVGAFIRDITEHRRAEDRVRTLLAEKELLLKEVHHRVKNNMSTVAGMLSLQAGRMKNPEAARALQEARDRVVGISRIYEKLFQTGDYKSVRLSAYLPKLIDEIAATASLDGVGVRVEKDIDELEAGVKLLLPLGLILNEILTNAFKYAFPAGAPGRIVVTLKRTDENSLRLTVSDDGVGMPSRPAMEQKGGFGIMLVKLLVQQIEWTITPVEGKGTAWQIDFPVEQD